MSIYSSVKASNYKKLLVVKVHFAGAKCNLSVICTLFMKCFLGSVVSHPIHLHIQNAYKIHNSVTNTPKAKIIVNLVD
ncbi:hypothetical protein BC343_27760 [Mucilaginibacter pedocola]|uniref:Uncharacterized protein n=1 Tax=Mucilaginibacter pedocola TaxID=1792845 RepID=A0A1S9PG66_9SPHI|nr:hypothetical protein BC343_27760 [Mucilaginibacter pedocola]